LRTAQYSQIRSERTVALEKVEMSYIVGWARVLKNRACELIRD